MSNVNRKLLNDNLNIHTFKNSFITLYKVEDSKETCSYLQNIIKQMCNDMISIYLKDNQFSSFYIAKCKKFPFISRRNILKELLDFYRLFCKLFISNHQGERKFGISLVKFRDTLCFKF